MVGIPLDLEDPAAIQAFAARVASNPWVMAFACAYGSPACRGQFGNRSTVPGARALLAMGALQDFIARELEAEIG